MSKTKIEWTDATWNPVRGCTKVSEGCRHCYAETFAERWRGIPGHPYEQGFDLRLVPEKLTEPLRWRKPRLIFVNSMSDLFHPKVPVKFIAKAWATMIRTPQHTYQILTKRPERAAEILPDERFREEVLEQLIWSEDHYCGRCCDWYEFPGDLDHCPNCGHDYDPTKQKEDNPKCPECGEDDYESTCPKCGLDGGNGGLTSSDCCEQEIENQWMEHWPPKNVWLGTSCEDQATADERISHLRKCPAAVRFLSLEPLLGPIDDLDLTGIGWVIVGGESGPKARPCNVEWIRSIIEHCKAAGVPCFVKQLGAHSVRIDEHDDIRGPVTKRILLKHRKGGDPPEWPKCLRVREMPERLRRPGLV